MTCTAGGTYNFGSLTVSGGTVTFSGSATYNFSGTVTNSGNLTFGSGSFNLAQGLVTNGGTTTTFGAGSFSIGQGPSCSGGRYSICHTGTSLTLGASLSGTSSTFVLTSGIYNSGGETISFGAGSSNTYQIGASSNGYGLNVGGGSKTTLADAVGSNFQIVGDLYQSGGACITLPQATNHDINGSVSVAGGLTLGSGLYAIAGNFWAGASGGGDVSCANGSVGVSGINVAIALTGSSPKAIRAPSTSVFVIGSGYNHVAVSAPGSGTYQNVAVVGPLSTSVTGGISLTEGATATTVNGALYFPNGPMALSGGASIGSGAGQCLEIVATQVTLNGGTAVASQCLAGAGTSSTPVLVQ